MVSVPVIAQYLNLWEHFNGVRLVPGVSDGFIWKWSADGGILSLKYLPARHGLPNHGNCTLCGQEPEMANHLLLGCVSGSQVLTRSQEDELLVWWLQSRKRLAKSMRRGFDILIMLTVWKIWRERNNRVFNGVALQAEDVILEVSAEGRCWILLLQYFVDS
ncbi:hypothetical protein GQ55_5G341000 [Panicum hallii var. hallii]|uniref:Reverse transcriptase zinc-binding domain-containing protein n=1 Tax=Panicum hallii var. hallii TaxID=1504633 RepID=A0A2T7DM22_9POAL|nr:hypothetical protein GQ55_5G341000 [Panicum hallii var. hallii]